MAHVIFNHGSEMGSQRIARSFQAGVHVAATAFGHRAGTPCQLDHGGVFTQGMNHQGVDAAVASVQDSVFEQSGTHASAPQAGVHADAELGHAMFRKGQTFEEQLGNAARKEVGKERWITRVHKALPVYDRFLYFDRVYVGGGNARLLDGVDLGPKATVVSNTAGILGGIAIWNRG